MIPTSARGARVHVASDVNLSAANIWRLYRARAIGENRIKELKYDFGADAFNMKDFTATEATLGTGDLMQYPGHPHQPLEGWQKQVNKAIGAIRFGTSVWHDETAVRIGQSPVHDRRQSASAKSEGGTGDEFAQGAPQIEPTADDGGGIGAPQRPGRKNAPIAAKSSPWISKSSGCVKLKQH